MSRNSLLLSLLANNPNSRSNSLANREGLSPTMSFFPRSTSNSLQKAQKKESNKIQTSTQLIKLAHMLNVKVKQSYYFVFCKLEQIYKNKKSQKEVCKSQQNIESRDNQMQNISQVVVEEAKIATTYVQKPSVEDILSKVCEWHSAFSTKIKAQSDHIILRESFAKILRTSQTKLSLQKIERVFKKRLNLNFKNFIDKCSSIQNTKIKIQILIDTLSQFTHKAMIHSLHSLQNIQTKVSHQQSGSIPSTSKYYQTKTQPNFIQTSIFQTSLLTDRPKKENSQPHAQKVTRCMKIKVKQKPTNISKPIKWQSIGRLSKALKVQLKEPSKILIDESIFEDKNQSKNILINLHHEHLNIPIPDFADSCNIFRTLPDIFQAQSSKKSTLITQPLMIQHKKSVEMLPTEDGSMTERAKVREIFGQLKQTKSVSFKHNSLGKLKAKIPINISHSPLKKVEELFKTVQQFHSISATNKSKKLININLPNFLNHQSQKNRSSKTPLKELYEQINISHSKGKQNNMNRQRLFTERDKLKVDKGGLEQSGAKYKSSMLTREKKVKADKVQLSTARKMKMQIQNIISRRNKQLGRNQLYQLK